MEAARTSGRPGNLFAAAVLILVGLTVFAQTAGLAELETGSDPGPAGYPRLLAALLIVLAVCVGLQRGVGDTLPSAAGALRVAAAVALLVVYALVMESVGYVASTTGFLLATMLLLGIRRSWWSLLVPVVFSIAVFLVFYRLFGVPLPRGPIEGLLS